MEGVWVVGRQNADIADTLQLRDVAMTTTFYLYIGYNFGCMIAGDTLFESMGWVFGEKLWRHTLPEIGCPRDIAMATNFGNALPANRLWRETTTWGFRVKQFIFSQPLRLLVAVSGFVVAAIRTAPGGRLSRWELRIDTLIANILVVYSFFQYTFFFWLRAADIAGYPPAFGARKYKLSLSYGIESGDGVLGQQVFPTIYWSLGSALSCQSGFIATTWQSQPESFPAFWYPRWHFLWLLYCSFFCKDATKSFLMSRIIEGLRADRNLVRTTAPWTVVFLIHHKSS